MAVVEVMIATGMDLPEFRSLKSGSLHQVLHTGTFVVVA